MEIKLKNYELVPVFEFLQAMELKASDSRHRSKVAAKVKEAIAALQEAQKDLQKEFAVKKEGEIVYQHDGINAVIQQDKMAEYTAENEQLLSEEVIIQSGMFASNFKSFAKVLAEYDAIISGINADVYDRLLTEFEQGEY